MVRLIRFIIDGNALEALGVLVVVLLVRWGLSLIFAPKLPTADTLLGGNTPPPPPLTPEPDRTPSSLFSLKLALGLLAAVLAVGGVLFINRDSGGLLHVVVSDKAPGQEFDLRVDDAPVEPVLRIGQHLAYPVPSGRHEIYLRDPGIGVTRIFRVDIQEGDAFMLSVHPDTCAVQIDMSPLTYGRPTRSTPTQLTGIVVRTLPVMTRFMDTASPLRIPGNAALSFNELPETWVQGQTASILTPLPCSLAQDDRSTWTAVRTLFPGLDDAAQRVGYTEEDPTRSEVAAMDDSQLRNLFELQKSAPPPAPAQARETPP
ncbi:hypothetical protein D7W79_05650 [Corallococcus exercitus]|uniref:Uncharacterized protein n=1 Tax=Corallococcus exercitus TaxID=2316736 RepID=A0A3A8ICX4_9BACT|nr:hypothetical protein [Corallococcus exercitus]NOK35575.1 hypothetical protein [Corallococcus exercitus]RKG81327.1 hypothetical protein D7W79_05650 [Corallococcus exercitus]